MDIKKVEQELKDIPLELRKLRATKIDLQDENGKLQNEVFALREKILVLKQKQIEEGDKLAKVTTETDKVIQENKKLLVQRDREMAKLIEKEGELEALKAGNTAILEKTKQIEITNIRTEEKLKEANKKLQESQAQVERDKLKNIAEADQNKARQADLDKQLVETLKIDKTLSKKNDNLDKILEEARVVKEEYERKVKEVDEQKKVAIAQISLYKTAEESYQDQQVELETLKEELREEIKKMKGKSESFDRMNAELSNGEKRIELAELKLQKFARDKGLEKELKELQEELKKSLN